MSVLAEFQPAPCYAQCLWKKFVIVALLSAGAGWGVRMLLEPEPPPLAAVTKTRAPTQAELKAACEDTPKEEKESRSRLRAAQDEVARVRAELQSTSTQLSRLRSQQVKDDAALAKAEKSLAALQIELSELKYARDKLLLETGQTVKQVERERDEARARTITLEKENGGLLWDAFQANAKSKVCRKTVLKQVEANCTDDVSIALDTKKTVFLGCLKTGQAVPVLLQGNRSDALPDHATWLDEGATGRLRTWYVLWCDPKLPEATGR